MADDHPNAPSTEPQNQTAVKGESAPDAPTEDIPSAAWTAATPRSGVPGNRFVEALKRSSKALLLVAAAIGLLVGIGIGAAANGDKSDELSDLRAQLGSARDDATAARSEAVRARTAASSTTTTTVPPTTVPPTTVPPTTVPPPTPPPNSPTMSLDEFNRVGTGMSYEQVAEIVGGPGQQLSHTDIGGYVGDIYMWSGAGGLGANANVQFQNGKVIGKAQFGLR